MLYCTPSMVKVLLSYTILLHDSEAPAQNSKRNSTLRPQTAKPNSAQQHFGRGPRAHAGLRSRSFEPSLYARFLPTLRLCKEAAVGESEAVTPVGGLGASRCTTLLYFTMILIKYYTTLLLYYFTTILLYKKATVRGSEAVAAVGGGRRKVSHRLITA